MIARKLSPWIGLDSFQSLCTSRDLVALHDMVALWHEDGVLPTQKSMNAMQETNPAHEASYVFEDLH